MSDYVTEVSDSSFEKDVLQSDRLVLVDFWAEWCAPCRMLAPTVDAVAEKYAASARVVKLNVDDNPSVSQRYGACCELLFKCPFLKKHRDGTTTCGIYENRPNSCRLFPIERRDIQEVRGTCSYYFIEKPVRLEKAS